MESISTLQHSFYNPNVLTQHYLLRRFFLTVVHLKDSSLTFWQTFSTACKTSRSTGWTTMLVVSCSRPAAFFRNTCSCSSAERVSRWLDWNLLSSSSSCFSKKLDSWRAASVALLLASRPSIRVFFSCSMLFLPTTRPSSCCGVK